MQIQKINAQNNKTAFGMKITPDFIENVMIFARNNSKQIEAQKQVENLSKAIGDEFTLSKKLIVDKKGQYKLFHTVHKKEAPEVKYLLSESDGNPNSKTWYTPEDENSFDMFMFHSREQLQNMEKAINTGDAYILLEKDFN